MPIYEFYCRHCHTLLNFFSSRIDTTSRPPCPRCQQEELERRPARFATPKQHADADGGKFEGFDDEHLGKVMGSMMGEFEALGDDEDPKKMAQLFRQFGEAAGLQPGSKMEEYLERIEAGEDADRLEEEMDGAFEDDDPLDELFRLKRQGRGRSGGRPKVDETLYFL